MLCLISLEERERLASTFFDCFGTPLSIAVAVTVQFAVTTSAAAAAAVTGVAITVAALDALVIVAGVSHYCGQFL